MILKTRGWQWLILVIENPNISWRLSLTLKLNNIWLWPRNSRLQFKPLSWTHLFSENWNKNENFTVVEFNWWQDKRLTRYFLYFYSTWLMMLRMQWLLFVAENLRSCDVILGIFSWRYQMRRELRGEPWPGWPWSVWLPDQTSGNIEETVCQVTRRHQSQQQMMVWVWRDSAPVVECPDQSPQQRSASFHRPPA